MGKKGIRKILKTKRKSRTYSFKICRESLGGFIFMFRLNQVKIVTPFKKKSWGLMLIGCFVTTQEDNPIKKKRTKFFIKQRISSTEKWSKGKTGKKKIKNNLLRDIVNAKQYWNVRRGDH